jgi:beta-lactamase class A
MLIAATLLLAAAGAAPGASPASTITTRIEERVRAFRGVMGVCAIELATGETIAVNADVRFPTASAIKTAVMAEVFQQMEAGTLRKGQLVTLAESDKVGGSGVLRELRAGGQHSVGDLLYLMIAISDNTATNLLVRLVGTRAVDDRMVAWGLPQTRLYRPTFRGGHPDVFPDEEREFGLGSSTPREMAQLMARIAQGRAVSTAASAQMMEMLAKQQVETMLPRQLPGEDAGVHVAHKTGEDDEKLKDADGIEGAIRVDAGVVTTPRGRYAIAIFARRGKDTRWSVDNEALVTGAAISRMVFDHFNR